MGTILMHLNSETNGISDNHLFDDVLTITSKFLNDYFRAYYEIDTSYFKSVTLRLRPFNIQTQSDTIRTAQLEFAGILSFSVQPVPTTTQVDKLIENAFSGRNLGKFLETFLRSNNDFLKNLQNVEIVVRDNLVTQDLSSEKVSEDIEDNTDNGEALSGWMAIMVYGVAIVAGIILAVAMVFLCRCCCIKRTRKADHRRLNSAESIDSFDEDNQRNQKQSKKQKKKSKKARKEEKKEETEKLHESMFSDRPPSPDKSEYSYNQNDISLLSTDTGSMSLMSKASLGLSNYIQTNEVSYSTEPGRKNRSRSGASIPYGQDVSLLDDIQLNVLGQIEEDEESMYSVSSHSSPRAKKVQQDSDSVLEIRKQKKKKTRHQSKLRQPSPSLNFSSKKGGYSDIPASDYLTESFTDSTTSPSSGGSGSDDFGADVVDDLNDLSFQIKSSRGRNPQHI